jgi:putative ABC transport system permease protein
MIIAILFLAVCALNLIGVLLGKFFSRAPEVSVRRAMGASRRQVFLQHVIECEVVGLVGGILGIPLAMLGLEWINRLFEGEIVFHLDTNMLAVAILLALIAGLIAGAYPAWRICSIPPARYLKEQ